MIGAPSARDYPALREWTRTAYPGSEMAVDCINALTELDRLRSLVTVPVDVVAAARMIAQYSELPEVRTLTDWCLSLAKQGGGA